MNSIIVMAVAVTLSLMFGLAVSCTPPSKEPHPQTTVTYRSVM